MKVLTIRKIVIIVLEFIITETIFFFIQLKIPTENLTNIKMKTFIDNAIIIGTILIVLFITVQLIYWYIKNKIITLKEFRDYEALSVINFYNSEIKKLNDRLLKAEKKLKLKSTSKLNENEKRLFNEEAKTKKQKIIEYNSMFKDWKCGNYGNELSSSFYKKLNYKD